MDAKGIELLAPAKDLEYGRAAIDCGADAVYVGGSRFGAREAVGNGLDDIAALAEHAHRYWARVYVTLNTLLRDDELPEAVDMVEQLHAAGVDGLIIQDPGLLECDLPPLPLIASTQMHNHTPEKVAFLERVGFQRVILARELSLEEIRAIRDAAPRVELECFVHGALCVSYSGQCCLSYAIGGRSGNRGRCAQPCRKEYTLVDAHGRVVEPERHLLSLRDLNLSNHLGELLDAGVTSFKIEGRLKDRAYVSNVVSHYRARLDALLQERGLRRSSSGTSRASFVPDPGKTFNRGYTTYFLHGRKERIGALDTPKMVGEPVGRVARVDRGTVEIGGKIELRAGDGLCFFDRRKRLQGTTVNAVRGRIVALEKTDGLEKGVELFRNHDHEFLKTVRKTRVERRIGGKGGAARDAAGVGARGDRRGRQPRGGSDHGGFRSGREGGSRPARTAQAALQSRRDRIRRSGGPVGNSPGTVRAGGGAERAAAGVVRAAGGLAGNEQAAD